LEIGNKIDADVHVPVFVWEYFKSGGNLTISTTTGLYG
jgi:hypothetical protein